jgi:predicted nucleic-acid-binding Zn-ribbon protein
MSTEPPQPPSLSQPTEAPPPLEIVKAMESLTTAEITAYLQEKTKHADCPTCGTNNWTVMSAVEVGITLMFIKRLHETPQSPRESVPVITIVCSNCGHLKHYAGLMIGEWKAKRGRPA